MTWRSYYIASSLAPSTCLAYTSALQSYHSFCHLHNFPLDPTVNILGFFLTFCSLNLRPQTLSSYLSGICSQLEIFYPQICELCRLLIVCRTLAGIHCVHGTATKRKRPLLPTNLDLLLNAYSSSPHHDNLLFLTQVLVGFNQLLRLAELCAPNDPGDHDDNVNDAADMARN